MNWLAPKLTLACALPMLAVLVLGGQRAVSDPVELPAAGQPPIPPPLDEPAPSLRQPESILPPDSMLPDEREKWGTDSLQPSPPSERRSGTRRQNAPGAYDCGPYGTSLLSLYEESSLLSDGDRSWPKLQLPYLLSGGHLSWPELQLPEIEPSQWFRYSSRDGRSVGRGTPLRGTSWLNRPLHFDWFVGALFGDEPIGGEVQQGTDFFGGYRLGADLDHYWGIELRAGWGQLNASNTQGPPRTRRSDVFISDLSILYYPWGDSRWRPYGLLGFGVANFDFVDHNGFGRNETLIGMPIGGGVKFQFRRWLAMRAEVLNNMAFGGDRLSTMYNVSLLVGFEIHWGARRPSYWPWQPGRHTW